MTRSRHQGCPIAAAFVVLQMSAGAARAIEQMPVIVTYESQKRQETLRAIRLDPKAFWTRQILTQIEAKRLLPPKPLKVAATVRVVFTIAHDGRLVRSAIGKSSGLLEVDQIAMAMVTHAEPFPPMPAQLADDDVTFELPVRFR